MATAAQRSGFNKLCTSQKGNGLIGYASQVAGDTNIMPVDVCFLLHLPENSTYAKGSTYVTTQLTNSEPPLIG